MSDLHAKKMATLPGFQLHHLSGNEMGRVPRVGRAANLSRVVSESIQCSHNPWLCRYIGNIVDKLHALKPCGAVKNFSRSFQ